MNARAHIPSPEEDERLALEILRGAVTRLRDIAQHLTTLGVFVCQKRMPARIALQLAEQAAPGIIERVFLSSLEGASPEQLGNHLTAPLKGEVE
jgi:hypothetical protein